MEIGESHGDVTTVLVVQTTFKSKQIEQTTTAITFKIDLTMENEESLVTCETTKGSFTIKLIRVSDNADGFVKTSV